uniref:Uncharacterized protein n=1 Tax=Neovison vison TaxID=452646 RepID=A0A8C7AX33_NEOVI
MRLTRFEQKNGHLAQVEVDEVFGFMCHVTTEVPPHDAVPPTRRPRPHLFNMGRNVLLYVIFLQRLSCTLHRVLLHLLRHVGVFDHGLSVAHGYLGGEAQARGEDWGRVARTTQKTRRVRGDFVPKPREVASDFRKLSAPGCVLEYLGKLCVLRTCHIHPMSKGFKNSG